MTNSAKYAFQIYNGGMMPVNLAANQGDFKNRVRVQNVTGRPQTRLVRSDYIVRLSAADIDKKSYKVYRSDAERAAHKAVQA